MKLVLITFAGKKCHLEILFKYILKYKNYIDEYKLFISTNSNEDHEYIKAFAEKNDFVTLEYYKENGKIILNGTSKMWDYAYSICNDDDTIYLKLDDDIVYIEETLFTDFIKYRETCEAPLLFPVIINNVYFSNLFSNNNVINLRDRGNMLSTWPNTYSRIKSVVKENIHNNQFRIGDVTITPEVLCPTAWSNLRFCIDLHNLFINKLKTNNISDFYLDNHVVPNKFPVSICCCSWRGKDLKKIVNEVGKIFQDEPWWTVFMPTWLNTNNMIYGKTIVSHYSYYRQRELGLDTTNILNKYNELIPN